MMWWSKQIPHLPEGTGPFVPGCMDIMFDYSRDGLFMRFYYPTDHKKNDPVMSSRWPSWIPDDSYVRGIAEVVMSFLLIVRLVLWWSAKKIPTIYGAKPRLADKLKCVIFSHGLGGSRFMSSSILYDLASWGYLVVALEHRDNSACHTYYYRTKEDVWNDVRTPINYRRIELGKTHYEKRYEQVCYRANECQKVLDFLLELNSGTKVAYNILEDLPTETPIEFKLSDLVGNLDVETITISGHSFGGATALLALAQRPEFRQAILLDPWMFPIKNNNLERHIQQPLLFINTQTFHIATNVSAMAKFLTGPHVKMYTILHTTHENQTDSVFVVGYWLNWFMTKLDPLVAWQINDFLILEFLQDYVGTTAAIDDCRRFLNEQKHNIVEGLTKPWP